MQGRLERDRLAGIDEAAGQRELPSEGRIAPSDQQQAIDAERDAIEEEIADLRRKNATQSADEIKTIGGIKFIGKVLDGVAAKDLRGLVDDAKKTLGSGVAAFISEPIQGAGGVILPPDTYWPEIERICRHYGILLVTDEVICGFGRTGEHFWGYQAHGIVPDMLTFAKGVTSIKTVATPSALMSAIVCAIFGSKA